MVARTRSGQRGASTASGSASAQLQLETIAAMTIWRGAGFDVTPLERLLQGADDAALAAGLVRFRRAVVMLTALTDQLVEMEDADALLDGPLGLLLRDIEHAEEAQALLEEAVAARTSPAVPRSSLPKDPPTSSVRGTAARVAAARARLEALQQRRQGRGRNKDIVRTGKLRAAVGTAAVDAPVAVGAHRPSRPPLRVAASRDIDLALDLLEALLHACAPLLTVEQVRATQRVLWGAYPALIGVVIHPDRTVGSHLANDPSGLRAIGAFVAALVATLQERCAPQDLDAMFDGPLGRLLSSKADHLDSLGLVLPGRGLMGQARKDTTAP